ncbi:MAG: basic amino acid ABC transporter substrate-binding protein [Cellulosilyticaceae bacterium]
MKLKLMKCVNLIMVGVLSIGIMSGCSKNLEGVEGIQSKGKIVMGTNATFPPFEEIKGTEIVGFDPEIGKLIADKLGVELEIMDMEFGQLMGAVNSGKIDFIAAAMTNRPDRATQVDFSKNYFQSKQVMIVKENNTSIMTADDLVGKKVGVQLGTTGDLFASDIEDATVIQFDKAALAVKDLVNEKIDVVIVDEEPAKLIVANEAGVELVEAPFIEEEYAIAVKKGNETLLKAINELLEEIKQNGTYNKLYEQYFGEIE